MVVIDAPPEAGEIIEEAENLFSKPVTTVLLTHGHSDHIEGLDAFLRYPLTVYCSETLFEQLKPSFEGQKANLVGIKSRLILSFAGDIPVELFTVGTTAHSPWDIFIKLPEADILCTGDSVVDYQYAYFHSANIRYWISALQWLEKEKCSYILAGHGDSLFPFSYIRDFSNFLSTIKKAAEACFSRYRPSLENEIRFANISVKKIKKIVADFFSEKNESVLYLKEKAGSDAEREVRMVIWEFIREWIR